MTTKKDTVGFSINIKQAIFFGVTPGILYNAFLYYGFGVLAPKWDTEGMNGESAAWGVLYLSIGVLLIATLASIITYLLISKGKLSEKIATVIIILLFEFATYSIGSTLLPYIL